MDFLKLLMSTLLPCTGLRSMTQEVCVLKERYEPGLELVFPMNYDETCSANCNAFLLCHEIHRVMKASFVSDDNLCQCELNQQLVLSKSRQQATCNWEWCWDSYLEVLSEKRAADPKINVRRATRLVSHWEPSCAVASQVDDVANVREEASTAVDDCDVDQNLYPKACHLEFGPGRSWRESVRGCPSNNYLLVRNGRKLVGLHVEVEDRYIDELKMRWRHPQELHIRFKMDTLNKTVRSTLFSRRFRVQLNGFQEGTPAQVWTERGYRLTLFFHEKPEFLSVTWIMRAPLEHGAAVAGHGIPEVVEDALSYVNLQHVVQREDSGNFWTGAMRGCIE